MKPLNLTLTQDEQTIALEVMRNLRDSGSGVAKARDLLAFQYLTALATFDVAVASSVIAPKDTVQVYLLAFIPLIICIMGLWSLYWRVRQHNEIHEAHIHVENVLGCYAPGQKGEALLPEKWLKTSKYVGMKQYVPSGISMVLLGVIGIYLAISVI